MLVGLLFIIMFGLVVSELTGGGASSAAIRARGERALAQRYTPSLQVEPPPPGEAPGGPEVARGDGSGASLRLAHHAPDACSFVEVRVVPRPRSESTEGDGSRRAGAGGPSVETIEDTPPPQPPPPPAPPAAPGKKYIVKAKDSLIKIARAEYGRENERQYVLIQQANHLAPGVTLGIGQELVIPPLPAPARTPGAAPPAPSRPQAPAPGYTVMGLEDLRRTFGPAPAPEPTGPAPGPTAGRTTDAAKQFHVVRRGDNLGKIAREKMKDDSQASIRRLYNANKGKLRDPDNLPVGVRLEIPA
jgi:nucleoid-associated protein YgaU